MELSYKDEDSQVQYLSDFSFAVIKPHDQGNVEEGQFTSVMAEWRHGNQGVAVGPGTKAKTAHGK